MTIGGGDAQTQIIFAVMNVYVSSYVGGLNQVHSDMKWLRANLGCPHDAARVSPSLPLSAHSGPAGGQGGAHSLKLSLGLSGISRNSRRPAPNYVDFLSTIAE